MGRMRKQRKPAIEGDKSSLPCEIIYSILSKLPVKSLLRFKCVCKSWRAVISEPQFVKSHLNESIKLDRQRIFRSDNSDYFYSKDYESCVDSEEKLCFPYKKYRKARVVCSCNGLVLLGLDKDKMCVLWNPSTRAYKKFSSPFHIYRNYEPQGLFYDSSMDDYKVVFISKHRYPIITSFFVVFSFKGQCWTEAREFPYLKFDHLSVLANGVLHWVALKPLITKKPGNSTPARVANVRPPPPQYLSSKSSSDYSSSSSDSDSNGDGNDKGHYSTLVRPLQDYGRDRINTDQASRNAVSKYLSSDTSSDSSSGDDVTSSESDSSKTSSSSSSSSDDDPPTFMFDSSKTSSDGNDDNNNSNTYISLHVHNSTRKHVIAYLDTVDEKFKEMPPPNCINEGDRFHLTVMRGCLSLYRNTINKKHVEVWTMKQYGEQESWTKLVVIPCFLGTRRLNSLTPLCATKEGEIVMNIDGGSIVIYNPKNNKCRSLGLTNVSNWVLYVDSLVLPIRTPQVKGKRKNEL